MSYARFGPDSDVYVYMDVRGHLACCGCTLRDDGMWEYRSTNDMVTHLEEHIAAGHTVPAYVIPELQADDLNNFDPTT